MRCVLTLALLAGAVGCADKGEPVVGHSSPCATPQGGLLGCPPPRVVEDPMTIEGACWRLVDCGTIPLERLNPDGTHNDDWAVCLDRLIRRTPDRLEFTLRCMEVASCQDLRFGLDNPCFLYGAEPP